MMESDQNMNQKDYKWQLRNGWIPNEDYVFVSYSSRDWAKVYPCVMAMRARGINVYIDIEFMENQSSSWLKNFQERLFRDSGCKGIVTFLSINYMRSYACLVEQMSNRTNRMRRHAGRLLPVFYVALEPELRTLQEMYAYIYSDEVRRESTRERVVISPPEYSVLQKFILDSGLPAYQDTDSVQELLDDIHDKHDVVINMYDLIFSNSPDMPSIQFYEGAEACAQLLTDNFINDKNNSIKLTILEDLKQESIKRRIQTRPGVQPVEKQYTVQRPVTEQNIVQQPPVAEQIIIQSQQPATEQSAVQKEDPAFSEVIVRPAAPIIEEVETETDNQLWAKCKSVFRTCSELLSEQTTVQPSSTEQNDVQEEDPALSDVVVRPATPIIEEVETDNQLWTKCKSVFRSCSELLSEQNIVQHPVTEQDNLSKEDPALSDVIVRPASPKTEQPDNPLWAKYKSVFRSRPELLCRQCGAALRPGGKFCSKCGAKIN